MATGSPVAICTFSDEFSRIDGIGLVNCSSKVAT